jgi:alkylated DNA repair dioxygenase AlkB
MQALVEAAVADTFNSCLLNLYRDGKDSQGWHADNEAVYGETPTIASVTLGAPRDFILRRTIDHSTKLAVTLGEGDLLVMRGALQQHWQHSVPKRAHVQGERMNLTFRRITSAPGLSAHARCS